MSNKKSTDIKLDDRVLSYKNDLYEKTVNYLKNVIPKKIQEFQQLSQQHSFSIKKEEDGESNEISKKRKLGSEEFALAPLDDLIKTNKFILENHQQLKKHYIEIIEIFSTIRAWISLNIPRIEDGNNFGVDIQEDIISQITKLEEVYSALIDNSEHYFVSRAQIIKKALKHREIETYRYAISQLDEKEFIRFNFSYSDLVNNYSTTYSLIVKNFAKLEQPRPTNNASSMF